MCPNGFKRVNRKKSFHFLKTKQQQQITFCNLLDVTLNGLKSIEPFKNYNLVKFQNRLVSVGKCHEQGRDNKKKSCTTVFHQRLPVWEVTA